MDTKSDYNIIFFLSGIKTKSTDIRAKIGDSSIDHDQKLLMTKLITDQKSEL